MIDWEWEIQPTYEGLIEAIEGMNCGFIVETADGIMQYANSRVLEWTGYRPKELDGRNIAMLIPEELHPALEEERKLVLEGDRRKRLSALRRKDGRTFPVAVAPQAFIRDGHGDGDETAILCILLDLGEVQTARPMGVPEDSLAADLAQVALKLQSMSFSARVSSERTFPVDHPVLSELSEREREVLEQLMSGSRVPAIAKDLFISQNTVRNHLKAIYRKVGVSSQSALIELVRSLGAASPD